MSRWTRPLANTARYVGSAIGVAIGIAVGGGLGWATGVDAVLIGSAVLLGIAGLRYAAVGWTRRPGLA